MGHIKISKDDNGIFRRILGSKIFDKMFIPLLFIIEFVFPLMASAWCVDVDEMYSLDFRRNKPLLFVPVFNAESLPEVIRRYFCADGYSIVSLLAVNQALIAEFFEIFIGETFIDCFQLLEAQDIDVVIPVIQPCQDEVLPGSDRIDVETADFHGILLMRSSLILSNSSAGSESEKEILDFQ